MSGVYRTQPPPQWTQPLKAGFHGPYLEPASLSSAGLPTCHRAHRDHHTFIEPNNSNIPFPPRRNLESERMAPRNQGSPNRMAAGGYQVIFESLANCGFTVDNLVALRPIRIGRKEEGLPSSSIPLNFLLLACNPVFVEGLITTAFRTSQ